MAKQPRVEYAGALHHVMSRGNDGIPIFRDDEDRMLFLDLRLRSEGWVTPSVFGFGPTAHPSPEAQTPISEIGVR